jgi:mono/diheme cytochrome c family protein
MRLRVLLVPLLGVLAAACLSPGSQSSSFDQTSIDNGRVVAERECSACHATGLAGPSPRRDAPVFRNILSRYHSDTLETELVQGIKLGHPDMPQFQLNPKAVSDLVVYLKWLEQR